MPRGSGYEKGQSPIMNCFSMGFDEDHCSQ